VYFFFLKKKKKKTKTLSALVTYFGIMGWGPSGENTQKSMKSREYFSFSFFRVEESRKLVLM